MSCFKCGATLARGKTRVEGEYAGEKFSVKTEAMRCTQCGFVTVHASQMDAFTTALADAYRKAHQLLTSQDIRNARARLAMSQEQFAEYLGVGPASIKRWEHGQAQDGSMDKLIRLKCSLPKAEENVATLLMLGADEPDRFSGCRGFSFQKLANLIVFFLTAAWREKRRRLGVLHVNKLAWYSDAENYKRSGVSITGARYARLPYGPVLDQYRMIFRALEEKGFLVSEGTNQLRPGRAFDAQVFTADELDAINAVWKTFRNRLSSIVNLSHQERAWKETPHAKLISFDLVK